jgi:tocopherol O-methyltransferase
MIASSQEIRPEAVASHYDELDRFYRDVWGEHVHHGVWLRGDESRDEAVRQLVELAARAAGIGPGARVCDIGCGYGATSRMLAAEFGARVTAITVSPAQHAFARDHDADAANPPVPGHIERRGGGGGKAGATPSTDAVEVANGVAASNPDYRLGDWLANDLPAASFDAAMAIESSEHMPDLGAFFSQAYRVLRPGARLVVCAWLTADAPTPRACRWLLEPICREGRMPQIGTATDYDNLGRAVGFACEHFEDLTRQVAPTWPAIIRCFLARLATRPGYLRFLLTRHARNRVFALTIFRIMLAYRTGAMRYGIFTFAK